MHFLSLNHSEYYAQTHLTRIIMICELKFFHVEWYIEGEMWKFSLYYAVFSMLSLCWRI